MDLPALFYPALTVDRTNRYPFLLEWIGRRVGVRETRDKIEVQLDAAATHCRIAEVEHHPEEEAIVTAAPEPADYLVELKQRSRKVFTLALRQLLRLVREYPREPLLA